MQIKKSLTKPVIAWTGTKFNFANHLIQNYIPRSKIVDECIEPFVGGGGFMSAGIFKYDRYIANDYYQPLIKLWEMIKYEPEKLIEEYKTHTEFLKKRGKEGYYSLRDTYNKHNPKDPGLFFTLIHNSYHSLVRFDSKGNFNASYGFERRPSQPGNIAKIIMDWSEQIQHVGFFNQDYRRLEYVIHKNCFVFLDPPYESTAKAGVYGNRDESVVVTPKDMLEFLYTIDNKEAYFCLTYDFDYTNTEFFKYKVSYVNQFKQVKKSEDSESSYYIYTNFERRKPRMRALF